MSTSTCHPSCQPHIEFFIDNLLVRIHFIIVMMRWTGLAPWELEFSFPGSLTSAFLVPITPSVTLPFFITLDAGHRRPLRLELSDQKGLCALAATTSPLHQDDLDVTNSEM